MKIIDIIVGAEDIQFPGIPNVIVAVDHILKRQSIHVYVYKRSDND